MTQNHTDLASESIREAFMPTGKLRVAMNFSNTVITTRDRGDGQPGGVTAALARELARRLGAELEFVDFDSPGAAAAGIVDGKADICFLALEPERRKTADFTGPYVLIESSYVVREGSPLKTPEDVDQPGVKVIVKSRAAYDLYLTRTLKHAELVRYDSGEMDRFVMGEGDALGGIKPMLQAFVRNHPGLTVMQTPFATIYQAIGVAKGRGPALSYLEAFVEEMKASGFVAAALQQMGSEATVAPPS